MNFTYKNSISVDEVNCIRKAMGWRRSHPEQLQNSLNGSEMIVSAYKGDEAVGVARLIWDSGSVAIIPDILVIPEYQFQGVEKELLSRILDFLRMQLKPGYGIQVDIRVWSNQETHYEEMGFRLSAPQQRGIPMHICLTNQIELTDKMFKQMEFKE